MPHTCSTRSPSVPFAPGIRRCAGWAPGRGSRVTPQDTGPGRETQGLLGLERPPHLRGPGRHRQMKDQGDAAKDETRAARSPSQDRVEMCTGRPRIGVRKSFEVRTVREIHRRNGRASESPRTTGKKSPPAVMVGSSGGRSIFERLSKPPPSGHTSVRWIPNGRGPLPPPMPGVDRARLLSSRRARIYLGPSAVRDRPRGDGSSSDRRPYHRHPCH